MRVGMVRLRADSSQQLEMAPGGESFLDTIAILISVPVLPRYLFKIMLPSGFGEKVA
jgi:hypothetical protein